MRQATSYRPRRVAELVADDLRRQIITEEIDGDLPREEVLLEQFKVSRPSLREALRILETEGLIAVRRGKVGGAEIRRPTAEGAAYHFGLVLQNKHATLSDVAAARLVIEPACSQMAALDADNEKVAERLVRLIDENETLLDSPSREFTESAQKFHETITLLCGNETMTLLAGALEEVWSVQEQHWAEEAGTEGSYPERDLRKDVLKAHRAIARRIAIGDGAGASRTMKTHLEHSQPFVRLQDRPIEVLGPPRQS